MADGPIACKASVALHVGKIVVLTNVPFQYIDLRRVVPPYTTWKEDWGTPDFARPVTPDGVIYWDWGYVQIHCKECGRLHATIPLWHAPASKVHIFEDFCPVCMNLKLTKFIKMADQIVVAGGPPYGQGQGQSKR